MAVAEVLSYPVAGGNTAHLCRCEACGFMFVDQPVWLEGSFGSELNRLDVGSADRSLLVASFVRGLLGRRSSRSAWKVLDVGGGDGLLTRVLRDHGIDCRWTDPFCEPSFYVGPPADEVDRFDLAVMSEVALHLTDPVATFGEVLTRADRLMFTATVPPADVSPDWWYLMPSTGQHVAFYPTTAIAEIAKQLGAEWCSDGKFFHLLSTKGISRSERIRIERREVTMLSAELYDVLGLVDRARGRQRSLTSLDQAAMEAALRDRVEVDRFDLAVMSEVALHLTDPVATFGDVLSRADRLMFTATVPPADVSPGWWYLMPSTGQHVAFYPTTAIAEIAKQLGAEWCSDGKFFHLLSTKGISRSVRVRIERREVTMLSAEVYDVLDLVDRARGRQRSLTSLDQAAAEATLRGRGRPGDANG